MAETVLSSTKHLADIDNAFERGVFTALYNSRKQRYYRLLAVVTLSLKHALRGILFSWPLYLLVMAALVVPGRPVIVFILLLLPGVYVSWTILYRGVSEDYAQLVDGYLLSDGFVGRLLFHGRR